ncbi:hypothetical protein B0I08_101319 [Glaciihabitans tibetensis]|uniref:Competence protein ComEC n=1 Tax=Glaciihabitans tibetensis TaxID=1266600 RepID=A0A2T0VIZ4_9MICO|nr:hypothetical protein [Glaciihabitans tibetensis]PRY70191.1 hypothetical protein B0I08_101319 [Glaciihabitans tibetensis]
MPVDLRITLPAAAAWLAAVVLLGSPELLVPGAVAAWALCAALAAVALARASRSTRSTARGPLFAGTSRATTGSLTCSTIGSTTGSAIVMAGVVAAAVALVVTVAAVRSEHRSPPILTAAAREGTAVTLTVVLSESIGTGPFAVSANLLTIAEGEAPVALAAVPVLVFDGAPPERVGIGATIEVAGQLVVTEPGDDAAYLLFASGPGTVRAPPPWYLNWAHGLRSAFGEVAGGLPGDGGALLPGLAIGDTSAVTEELDAAMKTSRLTHTVLPQNCNSREPATRRSPTLRASNKILMAVNRRIRVVQWRCPREHTDRDEP